MENKDLDDQTKDMKAALNEVVQAAVGPLNQQIEALKNDFEASQKNAEDKLREDRTASITNAADIEAMLAESVHDASGSDDDAVDRLSNKQLVDVISGALTQTLEAHRSQISKEIADINKPLEERAGKVENVLMDIVTGMGVKAAREQYSDFDEYKDEINAELKANPGLSFENAYILAKSKKSKEAVARNRMDTERPVSFPAASARERDAQGGVSAYDAIASRQRRAREAEEGHRAGGVVDFRSIVTEGAQKVIGD